MSAAAVAGVRADPVLHRYCYLLWPVQRVAEDLGCTPNAICDVIAKRGVNRGPGRLLTAEQMRTLAYASRMRNRQPLHALAAEIEIDDTALMRAIRRYEECRRRWVTRALEQHRQGHSWTAIAATCRAPIDVVRRMVARRARYEYAAVLAEQSESGWRTPRTRRMVAAYCGQGRTMREIAAELRRDVKCVHRALEAAGVARMAAGTKYTPERAALIRDAFKLRGAGLSYREIAPLVGRHWSTVRGALLRYEETLLPWVPAALQQHRAGIAWPAIAATLRQDVETIRICVSRRFYFERHIEARCA